MNQAQRSFLIKKITETTDTHIKALRDSIPEYPNLEKWLTHYMMSGKLQLRPNEEIMKILFNRAMSMTSERHHSEDWLGNSWGAAHKTNVHFKAREIFILPPEYEQALREYETTKKETEEKIRGIYAERETLILRIQLASDKILQTMISEVDDMGNIGLMDTKLKQLGGGTSEKLLN